MHAISGEEEPLKLQIDAPLTAPVTQEKIYVYGSASLVPGVVVSDRSRSGSKGNAIDYKVGIAYVPFDSVHQIPIFSVDYNFFHYFRPEKEISPYVSYGIGAAYFIPYVPLRAGIQFNAAFIDLGAKMLMGFIPSPEARGGINVKF